MAAPKQPLTDSVDISNWLTRSEAADLLGVTVATIRNWEISGRLQGRTRPGLTSEHAKEVTVYSPKQLTQIPKRARLRVIDDDPDEIAARAFELFDEGIALRACVVRLRKTPEMIEKLHDQWQELGGADLLVTKEAKTELERFVGSFATVADLCALVRAKLGATIEASVIDGASDADVERAIVRVLDEGEGKL